MEMLTLDSESIGSWAQAGSIVRFWNKLYIPSTKMGNVKIQA